MVRYFNAVHTFLIKHNLSTLIRLNLSEKRVQACQAPFFLHENVRAVRIQEYEP